MDAFDTETHKRNGKGQIYHVQEYRLLIEGGIRKFERPAGSGNWFYENGQAIEKPKVEAAAVVKKG